MSDFHILRKKGFRINPNDDTVNYILKKLKENDGHCPTLVHNRRGHDQCPCSSYLQEDICHCGLYVKEDKTK